MDYNFYLEQKYLYAGRIEARILTAAQAEVLGYEDDYVRTATDVEICRLPLFVDIWFSESFSPTQQKKPAPGRGQGKGIEQQSLYDLYMAALSRMVSRILRLLPGHAFQRPCRLQ